MDRVPGLPSAQGLYDPIHEKDACGVGFVVHVKGVRSHAIVSQALQLLVNLLHRGACGCEVNTGDGAGILIQMPDKFLRKEAQRLGFTLPPAGEYGCGPVFLPRDPASRETIEALIERIVQEEGQTVLGWRDLPTDDRLVGASAAATEPYFKQIFVGSTMSRGPAFERKLYVIRKRIEHAVDKLQIPSTDQKYFYIPSLSSQTLIYKGMLIADQIETFFPDLADPRRGVGAGAGAPALQHEHVSDAGRWPIRSATSPTTAKSTRCAATSTGCKRARRMFESDLSATTSKDCCRSSTKAAATRPCSTTLWSCSSWPAARLPHAVMMMIPEPGTATRR